MVRRREITLIEDDIRFLPIEAEFETLLKVYKKKINERKGYGSQKRDN